MIPLCVSRYEVYLGFDKSGSVRRYDIHVMAKQIIFVYYDNIIPYINFPFLFICLVFSVIQRT